MVAAAAHATGDFARFLPIDPGAVANRFGATVAVMPGTRGVGGALADHGKLSVRDGRWHIRVPKEISPERRRFSVAHEIGHILLFTAVAEYPALLRELRSEQLFGRVERLCNIGAAHVLMPTNSYTAAFDEFAPLNRSALDALATRFHVSLEAAARRITEVKPEWSVMFWSLSATHPRGVAWRTANQQPREGRAFLPSGLSSSRLQPDVVAEAAREGEANADKVLADLPGVARMDNVVAWHLPRGRHELVDVEHGSGERQNDRVFVFYRTAEPHA
ncbi:hypothetical protein BJP65_05435 [Microbacterium sp. BH-3-3-3]|nr:hypothetical protein BJP65_05435 [Microbacterium sp. BH-3-3-3]